MVKLGARVLNNFYCVFGIVFLFCVVVCSVTSFFPSLIFLFVFRFLLSVHPKKAHKRGSENRFINKVSRNQ